MDYFNWQSSGLVPGAPFNKTSPNIAAIRTYVLAHFGGTNLGTYGVRKTRSGSSYGSQWSTHAFGGAWDWGYGSDDAMRLAVCAWLIEHHDKLHVQMIVDEGHDRTWKSFRRELGGPGWKNSDIVGWAWLHIETTKDGWNDATPIEQRLGMAAPKPVPAPAPLDWIAIAAAIATAKSKVLREGATGDAVRWLQVGLHNAGIKTAVDGNFGPQTTANVRTFQTKKGIHVDGVVGRQTWGKLWP